jgi:hypothetical protein
MVTKKESASEKEKKGRVQLGKLSVSRETIKDLSPKEKNRIKGGAANVEVKITYTVVVCKG